MKKYTVFILIFFSLAVSAQSMAKRKARGNLFYKKIRVREVLDTMLWKEEAKIFNRTEKFFKANNIRTDIAEDYDFFQSNIMQQFLFSKRHILKRIKYKYQHLPYDELGRYINEINKGRRQKVIFSSGLYSDLKALLDEEMGQIKKYIVPKYLEILVKKHRPIDLKLHKNGRPVLAKDLDLEVFVVTNNADYQKVNILDKENNRLLKPDGYKYEQIKKLIIEYKGKEFVFKPAEYIENLPHSFKEVNNFISKYSFEEIPEWEIKIIETGTSTGIKLVNVVEANIVKTKPVKNDSIKTLPK